MLVFYNRSQKKISVKLDNILMRNRSHNCQNETIKLKIYNQSDQN